MTSQTQSTSEDATGKRLLKEFLLDAALQSLTDETLWTYKSNFEGAL